MGAEIRRATAKEIKEYTRVCAAGLGIPQDWIGTTPPEQTLCAFEDGNMVSTYRAIPFTVYINGCGVPAAGVADVSTLPTYRRRGYQRQIFSRHLLQLHEKGERPLIILWPSRSGIYRRYGCEFVTTQIRYRIDPRDVRFAKQPAQTGSFTEIGEQQTDSVADLYHRFASGRTGYLHRPRHFWEKQVVEKGKNPLFVRTMYEEEGVPAGYVMYEVKPIRGGIYHHDHEVTVTEVVYRDIRAFHALWRHLAELDLTSSIMLPSVSEDDPLPYLLTEPRAIIRMETESSTSALMGRIVDVDGALSGRGYQAEGRLTFEIEDDLCPWNRGGWEMEVIGGRAVVRRSGKSPPLAMGVDTLAALVFNHVNATLAARIGRLDVLEAGATAVWDAVLTTAYRPFCPDHF